jgi:hypothetical protein
MTEDMWTATMAAEDLPGDRKRRTADGVRQSSRESLRRFLLKCSEEVEWLAKGLYSFERSVGSEMKLMVRGRIKLVPYADFEHHVAETSVGVRASGGLRS